ncbi:hypothetical protein H8A97_30440 [Bradyrhizobium sp. Arg62]|uniref:hypothetical protein n=1 Tax=Bradyrhizobium brasilense TaxID=1419277 RepID=UPI001E3DF646|nr:hypothetical protein [Bradyrhizobium brasilense]MCC8949305.1 hypothetical protein [Bradyrhizobium brasilense]
MRKRHVITEEVSKKIEQLVETMEKPTASKIARKLGLKTGTVYWFMLCNGLVQKKPVRYRNRAYERNGIKINPYSPEHDAMLTEMRIAGAAFPAIAAALTERFGIPRNAHSVHNRAVMLAAFDDESEAA